MRNMEAVTQPEVSGGISITTGENEGHGKGEGHERPLFDFLPEGWL